MSTRPRKVETIVLGQGLAAAALADTLVQRGGRVALLVEEPGWEQGIRAAWRGWHHDGRRAALADAGETLLKRWQVDSLPGIATHDVGHDAPLWLLDYDQLLPALGERIAAGERCWVALETRVRGISVIENAILGAIAEDARYDGRLLVNAAEDARYAAFARMMRQPEALDLTTFTPSPSNQPPLDAEGNAGWSATTPYARDQGDIAAGETSVTGAWRVRGVAGWPLLALGAALQLAEPLHQRGVR